MPKVYKSNNKLIIAIPNDVVSALGIKEGDDIDFLKYGDNTFIIANKSDLVNLLTKSAAPISNAEQAKQVYRPVEKGVIAPQPDELAVLKKLDTLRYNDRTAAKVNSMLNAKEKEVLQVLLKKRMISLFKKPGDRESKYGISKNVYDMFLYRKKNAEQAAAQAAMPQKSTVRQGSAPMNARIAQRSWEEKLAGTDAYMNILESKGFLVLSNEADAAVVSASLEDSIRQGLVIGTRAFNKKFYIGLRGFINKNASRILKLIDQKSMGIDDISRETGVDEDGVRTILYVLSESGDVTEVRRDIFRAA